MSVRRFTGATNREAMARLRAALGDDALILANRAGDGGVEILALAEQDAAPQAAPESAPQAGQAEPARPATAVSDQLFMALRGAGFGERLAEEILVALPAEHPRLADARAWMERQLCQRLRVVTPGSQAGLDQGGVIALVGPTGVGKTTTAAKLAARHVLRHGPAGVALVSTDSYRIGARDQLRIYAELLEVDLFTLEEGQTLAALAGDLAGKSLVIIDTVGRGQRDERLAEQVRQLGVGPRVRPVLLLNAASQGETLDEVATIYRHTARAAGIALEDVIVSKQDEASRLGPVLDTLIRQEMRLHFVASGQRVPEDLAAADAAALVADALALGDDQSEQANPTLRRRQQWVHQMLAQGRALGGALTLLRDNVDGFAGLERAWAGDDQAMAADAPLPAALHWRGDRARLGLDRRGLPLGLPAAGLNKTDPMVLTGAAHLFDSLPDAALWRALDHGRANWLAAARRNTCVHYQGERRPLVEWWEQAVPAGSREMRHRGQPVQLRLRRLSVAAPPAGREARPFHALLDAWFGELVHLDSGARLGRRYWLLPAHTDHHDAVALVVDHLGCEPLATLGARAAGLAVDAGAAPLEVAGRERMALALAALACRLERDNSDWALDLRARLLSFLEGRPKRSAAHLLDALVHLLAASEAMRLVSPPGPLAER